MNQTDRHHRVLLLVIVGLTGLGLLLRLLMIGAEGLWYDEALTALSLRLPFGQMVKERIAAGHSPLYFAILYPFASIFGTGEMVVRLPSVFASTLSIYMFYLLAEKLFDSGETIITATLFYTLSVLNIYFAQEARMYAFCVLFAIMSFYYLLGALEGDGWKEWIPYCISTLVLMYLSASTIPVLFAQLAYVLIKRKRIVPFLISGAAVVVLYLPMGLLYLRMGRLGFIEWLPPITIRTYLELFYGFGFRPIPVPDASAVIGVYLRILEVLSLLIMVGTLIIGGLYRFRRNARYFGSDVRNHRDPYLLSLIWLFLPLIVLSVYSFLKQPMLGPKRYIYIFAPAFYLLLGYGIQAVRRTAVRRAVSAVVVLLFCLTLVQYYLTSTREDWRGAVQVFDGSYEQGEVLFGDLSTQVMYTYYGGNESTIIMDIRYLGDTGFAQGWILMRKRDYERLSPHLNIMTQYYEFVDAGPFYGLKMTHFRVK